MSQRITTCALFLCIGISGFARAQFRPFVGSEKFTNPDGQQGDRFGYSVAVIGDVVAVSARDDSQYGLDSGAVYLFDLSGELLTSFGSPNPAEDGRFGAYLAAVGDSRVLVGANDENERTGNAYLFDLEGQLVKTLAAPNPVAGEQFGAHFLLVNDESLFVPAWREEGDGRILAGAVHKFDLDGELVDTISAPRRDHDLTNCFGGSGAFVGDDRIIIGDSCESAEGMRSTGAAFLFDLDGQLLQTFENPRPASADGFGGSVAYAEGRILIGGVQIDDLETGASTGAAYIYEPDGTLVTRVSDPEPRGGNWFSWSVGSVTLESGEEAFLVGSVFNNQGAGKAFVVNRDGEIIQTLESPESAPREQFGISFAQLGNKLLVGEAGNSGVRPGTVWFFEPAELGDFDLNGQVDLVDLNSLCGDLLSGQVTSSRDITGDGLIDARDLAEFLTLTGRSPGDSNFDGTVTFADFLALSPNFGDPSATDWADGNFDCSGHVEFGDFLLLSTNFGRTAENVPEPQYSQWLILLLLFGVRCRAVRDSSWKRYAW